MKKRNEAPKSMGPTEMLAIELLRRAVEVREQVPVQILEFTFVPKPRRTGKDFENDPLYLGIKAKFLLLYHNAGERVPFLRITSANTQEEAYEFVYDIEGSVPIDIASATPRLFLKKWCHVKVKRSIGFSRLHQSRNPEEEWTIMLRNEHDDYFFGLSSDICVYVAGNRYLTPSNYWTVGSSHVSNTTKLLSQI